MKTTFSQDQYHLAYPDGIEKHWWNLARSDIVAKVVSRYSKPGTTLLEVGAGRGVAVKHLRERGFACYGVELAAVEALPGLEDVVSTGVSAEALPKEVRERYDTILLLDVIEHLPEPATFIHHLKASFPNASRYIITVPAQPSLWSNYDEFYGHYRRYTRTMLNDLVKDIGGTMIMQRYFFHAVYFPARLFSLLGIERNVQLTAPKSITIGIHKMLSKLMSLEFLCVPGSMVGSSAIACIEVSKPEGRAL